MGGGGGLGELSQSDVTVYASAVTSAPATAITRMRIIGDLGGGGAPSRKARGTKPVAYHVQFPPLPLAGNRPQPYRATRSSLPS
jgi:hypothetical protein